MLTLPPPFTILHDLLALPVVFSCGVGLDGLGSFYLHFIYFLFHTYGELVSSGTYQCATLSHGGPSTPLFCLFTYILSNSHNLFAILMAG